MTWREIIYMILDELKGMSDDFTFTEDHIAFLLGKYRSFILKQRYYTDIKKVISESNYQTICLDLIEVPAINGESCEGSSYLRSKEKIPVTLMIGNPRVYPIDYYQGNIAYISRDRMKYVGYNKWMKNIIYCSLAPDGYLYFKSENPQFRYLEKVRFTAIFEDAEKVSELACDDNDTNSCTLLDKIFPIEEALVPTLIELIVNEIKKATYSPEDQANNAEDDLADMISFIRRNMKSNLQKQIES